MKTKLAALFVFAAMATSSPAFSDPATEAFRANLVEENRIRALEEKEALQELLTQHEVMMDPCPDLAVQVENLMISGKISDVQATQIFSTLPERCVAPPTKTWTWVQTSHFFFQNGSLRKDSLTATSTFGSVEFKSLLACLRGSKGMETVRMKAHQYRAACVDTESGVTFAVH